MNPRILRAGSAALVTASLLTGALVAASPADATVRNKSCSKPGKRITEITGRKFVWDVAQRTREENFSGKSARIQFEITRSTSRTNSVKLSVGAKYSVDAVFSSFEASVHAEMGSSRTRTELLKTTRTYTLASGDYYVFGQGTGRWTGTATVFQCQRISRDGQYAYRQASRFGVTGYTGRTNAVVACKKRPPASSFSARLRALGC